MNKKRLIISLSLLALIISMGTFYVFPSTNSKYYDLKTNILSYNINSKKLEKTISIDNLKNITNGVSFSAYFKRTYNGIDTINNYKFSITEGCTINSVSGNGYKTFNTNKDVVNILYSNEKSNISLNNNTNIELKITCDGSSIYDEETDSAKVTMVLEENINNMSSIYELGILTFETNYKPELLPVPEVINDGLGIKIPKEYERIYESVTNDWLNSYFNGSVNTYYKTIYNSLNVTTPGLIDGLTITSDDDYYYFNVDKYFESKITTKYINRANTYFNGYWYFIGEFNDSEINNLFEYYYDNHLDPSIYSSNKAGVMSYLNSKGKISDVVNGTIKIKGLSRRVVDGFVTLTLDSDIMDYVNSPNYVEVEYSDSLLTIVQAISNGMAKSFNGTELNDSNRTAIKSSAAMRTVYQSKPSVLTYNYFAFHNDGQSVLATIESNPSTQKHTMTLIFMNTTSSYTLYFNESDIRADDITKVTNVLDLFDTDIKSVIDYDKLVNGYNTTVNTNTIDITSDGTVITIKIN